MKCGGGCSLPFAVPRAAAGVPLSTTLFDLCILDLHQRLCAACPGVGVRVSPAAAARQVADLGYADDITLCSSSPEGLQSLIVLLLCILSEHGPTLPSVR